jgi:hypothetical protein
MSTFRITALALAGAVALTLPAMAASKRRAASSQQNESSAVERLNDESLQRARQGQNSPTPGPDTTSNLNRMSDQDAQRGQNMNQAPMPFR